MGDRAVGRIAGEVDDLLPGQRGLADDRLAPALLAQLAQRARRLFFVGVDEDRIGVALLGLEHRRREVDLAGVGRDVGRDLQPRRRGGLRERIAPALAEVVVDEDHRDRLRLQIGRDVARDLRHRGRLREAGAKDERVALLGDRRRLAAGEVGDLGALGLGHADHDRARERRADYREHVVVDGLLREALGDAGVRLRVGHQRLDLLAEDAAGGVDLLHRELDAVLRVGAGGRAGARQLLQHGDLDRLRVRGRGQRDAGKSECGRDELACLHACLHGSWVTRKISAAAAEHARRTGRPVPNARARRSRRRRGTRGSAAPAFRSRRAR